MSGAATRGTRPASEDGAALLRDAAVTVATRFGLAILILATDVLLARTLGPDAKGRFALVLLSSQLAATIVGVGMDQALIDLGLEPHLLSETLVESMFGVIDRHKDRVITDAILPRTRWRPDRVAEKVSE